MAEPVCLNPNEIFHVHTWRCGHAGDEREEEYVRAAIRLGAEQIKFLMLGQHFYELVLGVYSFSKKNLEK